MTEYIYDINPKIVFDFVSLEGFSNAFLKNAKEEIVRCRDCKFCHKNYCEKRTSPTVSPSEIFWIPVEPDGFCKWGERRNNE